MGRGEHGDRRYGEVCHAGGGGSALKSEPARAPCARLPLDFHSWGYANMPINDMEKCVTRGEMANKRFARSPGGGAYVASCASIELKEPYRKIRPAILRLFHPFSSERLQLVFKILHLAQEKNWKSRDFKRRKLRYVCMLAGAGRVSRSQVIAEAPLASLGRPCASRPLTLLRRISEL